ncbi:transcriptional regulator [Vibrio sp. qd031]|uniref:SRPBCC family protein n=1 Tax=Vibrio sp. qd031 TaxID=1603038 RepID=UPI000A101C3E|nr:SRPBCC family protein [Vibrio sp. qd031]ORT48687.1 transcriptional regulator [Vibrio sp. qd031]
MLKYQVKKSIVIDAEPEQVQQFVADFTHWPSWSPWLITEPDCPLVYSGDQGSEGASYTWDGEIVGSGEMQLVEVKPGTLNMDLRFLRPFKSQAKVGFEFDAVDGGCKVSWIMGSQVPWFLFFLKNLFKNMIGMDYDRGLGMLKAKIETGKVESKLSLLGDLTIDATHYVSLRGGATIEQMKEVMPGHIDSLTQLVTEQKVVPNGPLFALYTKMDMNTSYSEFETCLPIESPVDLSEPFVVKQLPTTQAYAVEHTGAYNYLGNAWSMVMMASRHYKVKTSKAILGMERFLDSPNTVPEGELRTQVMVFKK